MATIEAPIFSRVETTRERKVLAYDPSFDRENYINLYRFKTTDPEEYKRQKQTLNQYTRRQQETHLGERFNVLLSKTQFNIAEGKMYSENAKEPFEDVLKRGRDYRRKYGKEVDFLREDAEAVGFSEVIQKKLCDDGTTPGTMMLSISLPGGEGSTYEKNFYDIFTLKEGERGRWIDARRYSSSLNLETAFASRSVLDKDLPAVFSPSAEYLLANPFEIKNPSFTTPELVYRELHDKHEFISEEDFEQILIMSMPAIVSYIDDLVDDPYNLQKQLLNFNATLNVADRAWSYLSLQKKSNEQRILREYEYALPSGFNLSKTEIYNMGRLPVREVKTGCGSSGGFSLGGEQSSSPLGMFSVSEFGAGEDKFGSREFDCPKCSKKNIRPKDQLIDKCQHCGSTSVSCESGEEDGWQEAA